MTRTKKQTTTGCNKDLVAEISVKQENRYGTHIQHIYGIYNIYTTCIYIRSLKAKLIEILGGLNEKLGWEEVNI